jgi:hypothetical protein
MHQDPLHPNALTPFRQVYLIEFRANGKKQSGTGVPVSSRHVLEPSLGFCFIEADFFDSCAVEI